MRISLIRCRPLIAVLLLACDSGDGNLSVQHRSFDDLFTSASRTHLQAPDDDPVGSVADIIHWGDRLAIADGLGKNVKVFGGNGSLVMTLGRAGDGPGEFRDPMALGVLGDGRLAVLDRRRVEVSFFNEDGSFDGAISVGSAAPAGMRPIRGGSALLVSSRVMEREGAVSPYSLHVFDLGGDRRDSFGARPDPVGRPETPFLSLIMDVVQDSIVMWGVHSRPEIHVATLGGEAMRTIRLQGIRTPDWDEAPNEQGNVEALFQWSTNHEWLVAIIPGDGFVAVRYHGGDGRQGTGWSRYILLDEEGREQLVTDRTDAEVQLIRDGRAYGVSIGDDGEAYLETYEVPSPF